MRNEQCLDCARLTAGGCGKHSGTYFETIKINCGINKVSENTFLVTEVTVDEYKDLAKAINKIIDYLNK